MTPLGVFATLIATALTLKLFGAPVWLALAPLWLPGLVVLAVVLAVTWDLLRDHE